MQGVNQRRVQPIGHGKRREAAMIVDDVEAPARRRELDLVEGSCHVVRFVE